MATAAAAIVARARRDVISHFMARNAVGPDSAVSFEPHSPIQRRMFERFKRRGVLVEARPNAWYLDVPTYDSDTRGRRKRALAAVALSVAAGAVVALLA